MRHHHRWPYVALLPLLFFLPTLLATPNPTSKTRHYQRQLHRLAGGHLRILDPDSDDSELITASAGENSKGKKHKSGDDERKTLSQQVADGKYGLIQKEIFPAPPKRPGILSYTANPEVPKDNIATLGGLTKNDIWLAENHLLVIKGGTYPPHDDTKEHVGQIWQPIDDYNAPLHQVKIPKNPKIPPPFPVQLTDDGPLQILGTNSSRTLNASAETPAYALPPPPGWDGEIPPQNEYFPPEGPPYPNPPNFAPGQAPLRGPFSGEPPGGLPFPPAFLNGSLPPFFEHLPPGAAILPAPLPNETDPGILDEDDPSIYYPPPYSFFYPKDNSSVVPPGPLVPGIILPPPPKFFAPLEEEPPTTTTKRPTQTRPAHIPKITVPKTTTTISNEITTPGPVRTMPTKVSVVKNYSKVTVRVGTTRKSQQTTKLPSRISQTTKLLKTTIPTTGKPKLITILPVHVGRLNRTYLPARTRPPVTILRPVKTEMVTPKVYLNQNEVNDKPYRYNEEQKNTFNNNQQIPIPERNKPKLTFNNPYLIQQPPTFDRHRQHSGINYGFISTTQIPLKYQSTANDIESNSVTREPPIGTNAQYPKSTPKLPANFYFYEEIDPNVNAITTERPKGYYLPVNVHPTQLPPSSQPPTKSQYVYINGRPYESQKPKFRYVPPTEQRQKSNTFSIHVAKLQNQLHQHYTTPRIPTKPTSRPVYQYSFEAHNYRRPEGKNFRPSPVLDGNEDSFQPMPKYSVQIQPAIEVFPTQQPSYQQIQPLNIEEPTYFSTERPQSNYNQYHQEVQIRQPLPEKRPNNFYNQYNRDINNEQNYVPKNLGQIRQFLKNTGYPPEEQKQAGLAPEISNPSFSVTPSRTIAEFSFEATPNPIHQGFYTQPDEGYLDEHTRQSFTIFGRKLPSTTTPIPTVSRPRLKENQDNYRQQDRSRHKQYTRPIPLDSDINVNYIRPRPSVNIHSEPILPIPQYFRENPQENSSPNPEVIKAIEVIPPAHIRENKDSYIQYQLPGDEGAHFYFLTPQQNANRGRDYIYDQGRAKREENKQAQAQDRTNRR